jgi:hypothetical protein
MVTRDFAEVVRLTARIAGDVDVAIVGLSITCGQIDMARSISRL